MSSILGMSDPMLVKEFQQLGGNVEELKKTNPTWLQLRDLVNGMRKVQGQELKEFIPVLEGYSDTLTMEESDEQFDLFWRSFYSMNKAVDFAIAHGGQFYTQVDTDDGEDVVYSKGMHIVNRTGVYLVVKKPSADAKADEEEFQKFWFSQDGIDEEDDDDYLARMKGSREVQQ